MRELDLVSGPKRLKMVRNRNRGGCSVHVSSPSGKAGAKRNAIPTSFKTGGNPRGRQVDLHAQRLHYVRGAAISTLRCGCPCLATRTSAPATNERCRGRNIERSAGIATGAASIYERVASGATDIQS